MRLVRLIRIAKLYKAATAKSKPKRDSVAEILALRRKKKRVHPNSKEFNMANGSSHLTVFTYLHDIIFIEEIKIKMMMMKVNKLRNHEYLKLYRISRRGES